MISLRELHIEKGHTEQLQRHIERLYPLLKPETIQDLKNCFKEKIVFLELQINNSRQASGEHYKIK